MSASTELNFVSSERIHQLDALPSISYTAKRSNY